MVTLPDIDSKPLTFGKRKGDTPEEIAQDDPSYIVWLYENVDPSPCSEELYEQCIDDVEFDRDVENNRW